MKSKFDKVIIGLAGPMASGKGTVARILAAEYGASTYRFSEVFRGVLADLKMDVSRSNMQLLSTALRKILGDGVFSKALLEKVAKDKNRLIVIDGFRRREELEDFRKLSKFYLVGITAESKLRYDRTVNRLENKDDWKKSYDDFLNDEKNEADKKINIVLKMADFKIKNNGSMADFRDSVRDIAGSLRLGGNKKSGKAKRK